MERGEKREREQRERGAYQVRLLREGYVPWLVGVGFTTFGTHTFESDVHPERAERIFARWFRLLGRQLPRLVFGVRAAERTTSWRVHYHTLLRGLMPVERVTVDEVRRLVALASAAWLDAGGGFSKWKPVSVPRIAYTCKYVAKGGELDPFGTWPGERTSWGLLSPLRPRVADLLDYVPQLAGPIAAATCAGCA